MAVERIQDERALAAAALTRQLAGLARLVLAGRSDADESLRSFTEQLFQAAQETPA